MLGAWIPIGDEIALLGMHRAESLGSFPDHSTHVLGSLIPPLRRLLLVRKGLDAANARTADLEATLDYVSTGVVRCTADGKIIYANRAALALLSRQDGLCGILGGRLGALAVNDGASQPFYRESGANSCPFKRRIADRTDGRATVIQAYYYAIPHCDRSEKHRVDFYR
jgi:PAS domain-containing protein